MKYKKGTFTTVPNLNYLNGKPSVQQAIFFWLCVHSDDEGICYPSRQTLAKESGCEIRTVDKYIKQLIIDNVLIKTIRHKPKSKENTSNLYQIMIVDRELESLPSESEYTTPSESNVPVTIPIINQIQNNNNILPPREIKTLPKEMGKAYTQRLLRHYSLLFHWIVGFSYKGNLGMDFRIYKNLMENYTELQIAMLLIVYFQWHGVTGTSDNDYQFVVNNAFGLSMFSKGISKYEIYARNVLGINMDDEDVLLDKIQQSMLQLQKN